MFGENERRDTLTQSVHTQLLQTKNAVAMNYRNTPPPTSIPGTYCQLSHFSAHPALYV
jgi:hypothetical protein